MTDAVAHYEARGAGLRRTYDSVTFDTVHGPLLPWLPPKGEAVLDVGAGGGRDAVALASRGYAVTAVEPAGGMRRAGKALHGGQRVRWVNDRLPDLKVMRAAPQRFGFILCSAVLMHVQTKRLAPALAAMAALLHPGGRLAVSVRAPQPVDPADLFFDHSPSDLRAAAAAAGLSLLAQGSEPDVLNRPAVRWSWIVFGRAGVELT